MSTAKVTKVTTVESTSVVVPMDNTNALELMTRFNSIKETIKVLDAEKSEVESQLREILGDAEFGTLEGVDRLQLVSRTKSTLDTAHLKEYHPEVWDMVAKLALKTTEWNFLKTL